LAADETQIDTDMKRKLQIFVSSTYKDLLDERQAAVSAILEAGHIPAGMELFAAGDQSQWETIKRWIDESDVFMLILGGRYGSIEPQTELSYIELEYDHAVKLKKPYFAVVIDESALAERIKAKGEDAFELENAAKLGALRAKVLSKMSSFFRDAKDVKLAIHKSIRDLESRHKMAGWVCAVDFPDRALAEEIIHLRQENEKLTKAKTISKTPPAEEEMLYLKDLLKSMKVLVPAFVAGKKSEGDVLSLFYGNRHLFTAGVDNSVGAGEASGWIFSNVGAPLEAHELVTNEKVAGAQFRRLVLSKKGARFLAFLDKMIHLDKTATVTK
jgi:hypothetical protein